MRNAFGPIPQWRENSYLHLLAGENGQLPRRLTYVGGDRMNAEIRIPSRSSDTTFSEGGWAGISQDNFLPLGWKGPWSLKADEPQVGQRHEDVERKWEYYHLIFLSQRTWTFTSKEKRTSEYHSHCILFHKPRSNKQHTYKSVNQYNITSLSWDAGLVRSPVGSNFLPIYRLGANSP